MSACSCISHRTTFLIVCPIHKFFGLSLYSSGDISFGLLVNARYMFCRFFSNASVYLPQPQQFPICYIRHRIDKYNLWFLYIIAAIFYEEFWLRKVLNPFSLWFIFRELLVFTTIGTSHYWVLLSYHSFYFVLLIGLLLVKYPLSLTETVLNFYSLRILTGLLWIWFPLCHKYNRETILYLSGPGATLPPVF